MATETLSNLCKACQAIFGDSSIPYRAEIGHHGLDALRARASRGCQLCLTIYMSIDPASLVRFQKAIPNSQGFASISPSTCDQACLRFRYGRALVGSGRESLASNGSNPNQPSILSSTSNLAEGLTVDLFLVKAERRLYSASHLYLADQHLRCRATRDHVSCSKLGKHKLARKCGDGNSLARGLLIETYEVLRAGATNHLEAKAFA